MITTFLLPLFLAAAPPLPQTTFPGALPQSTFLYPEKLTYPQARARALAEGKPLVVWVGAGVCPACVTSTRGEWVNVVVENFPEVPAAGGLVLGVPEGGDLVRVATITQWTTSDATFGHVPSLRRALAAWRANRHVTAGGWSTGGAVQSYQMQSSFQSFQAFPVARPRATATPVRRLSFRGGGC